MLIALILVLAIVAALVVILGVAVRRNLFQADDRADRRKKVWKHVREYGNWYLAAATWAIAWILVWLNNVPKVEDGVKTGKGGLIWEPALVALSLGLIALLVFAQIYDKEKDKPDRIRAAIGATFILVFLFLVVDLLTIQGFREALSDVSDVKVEVTTAKGLVVSTSVISTECEPEATPSPGALGDEVTGIDQTDACVPISNEGAATFVEGLFGTFKWALTAIIAFYFLTGAIEKASEDKTERERHKTEQEVQKTNQEKERTERERARRGGTLAGSGG